MDPSQKKIFKKREKNIVFERLVEPGGFDVCLFHSKRIMCIQNMTYIHIYYVYTQKAEGCTLYKVEARSPRKGCKRYSAETKVGSVPFLSTYKMCMLRISQIHVYIMYI